MQIIEKSLSEIRPYENNPRKNDAAVEYVANSIREFCWKVPIVIDKDGVIIAGHTRYKAAKKLGMKSAPCIMADDLTEDQVKAYRLADNKVGEFAEWDFDALEEELAGIELDMSAFGFDDEDDAEPAEIVEDEAPEEVETRCKLCDIWQLGNHRLICGDSTDPAVIDRLMCGAEADLVFTDPPYGMNAVSKSGVLSERYKTDILNDDDNSAAVDAFNLATGIFQSAKQVWWGANYYTECLPSSECWIVWDKNNGESDQTDCELAWTNFRSVVRQFTMASEKTNRVHPTQKPVKLFAEIVRKFDRDNSIENVVDLFGGSGSTLIACEQLDRKCYMCELDPHYCDVIIQRWENMTGKKAALLNV